MAQISSNNGFKPNLPPALGAALAKDIGKEEALQMEAEALARLQKEKKATVRLSQKSSMGGNPKATSCSRPDRDLIIFPESDAKKRADENKFRSIKVEELSHAELEKLLLDDTFSVTNNPTRPQSISTAPPLSVSSSTPLYTRASHFGGVGQWMPGPVNPVLPTTVLQTPLYSSTSFPKHNYSFQNGFSSRVPPYRLPEPVYIGLPPASQFVSFPLPPTAPMCSLPVYQPAVTPEMVKLFDKIASTSEYLKNGKSTSTDLESASTKAMVPKLPSVESANASRFDWLDLDPLTKPKVDNFDPALHSEVFGKTEPSIAKDPWDAVLQDKSAPSSSGTSRVECDRSSSCPTGAKPLGTSVTRSQSLNIKASSFRPAKAVNETTQVDQETGRIQNADKILEEMATQNEELQDFFKEVTKLRSQYPHDDMSTNPGYILSPVMLERDLKGESSSVKVSIETGGSQQPITFTCDDMVHVADDDSSAVDLQKCLFPIEKPLKEAASRQTLATCIEEYHKQVQLCLQNENSQFKTVDNVVQAVRNMCSALDGVETKAVTNAVKQLKRSVNLPRSKTLEAGLKSADGFTKSTSAASSGPNSPVEESMNALTTAVCDLLQLYLKSFSSSPASTESSVAETRAIKEAYKTTEHLQFTLFAAHGISANWVSSYEKYYMQCSLMHNGRNLFKPVQSKKVGTYKSFFYLIKWDELISFPIPISQLPLESVLNLALYGILNQNASSSPDSNKPRKRPDLLGTVSMTLFNFKRVLTNGTKLLNLCTTVPVTPAGPANRKGSPTERIVLQVDFPHQAADIVYVPPQPENKLTPQALETLDTEVQKQLEKIFSKSSSVGLSKADRDLLWDKRNFCHSHRNCLPKILASAPGWDWTTLPSVYGLLYQWPPVSPLCTLELLHLRFADTEVRTAAVKWLEHISNDEVMDYLPQLVQALKFECYLKNALVIFLMSRALQNIHISHYLYWLLKDAAQDPLFRARYENVLGALLSLCGKGLREELEKQTRFVQLLEVVAEKVRQAGGSARQVVLQEGMERARTFFVKNKCRLPLNPSLEAKEINVKACSFFNSNAVPLKIALTNADPLGDEINVMFKVGEDLRQDMLALQLIKIMDKLWIQEGLDLRIVNFKCISTGKDRGMVELVPSSETLRKIQVEYGVTGSFKDKPLAEWLRKYNPTEEEYEKASENFIYSCAGCCVATYVLGICDRHNDNIMLRSTGHMFHIDFGKFLGHAQMFGSFKRDRAPFVLTSDMAYVINGGEKPTSRFQLFVDLCSQAYNLIRKHANLFLNLLSLMTSSGLPELSGVQDLKYVYDALQPQTTDAEATIFFTRLIESSLGSVATKFNFFIHNLAQLRFSGLPSNDEPILSFSPKTYTLKQDGRIKEVSVFTYQKRYNPDKHYTYVVRVRREGQSDACFVFRTFDEFQELHNKLSILFPLWKLPGFPNKMVLGRTHIKDVAAKRKVELNSYIQNLMRGSAEVSECDLVYTFFHPMPRDDKAEGLEGIPKSMDVIPVSPMSGKIGGEVKLSISYRNSTLFIMVMHIKDLVTDDGTDPNPYVKTYLLPDPHKTSKRKTNISRKTSNPTFNEMLVYNGYSKETLKQRDLQLSVLSAESLRENYFLGGITLPLKDFDLNKETVNWHKLEAVPYFK
ncbi:phosphatidylinositol 4-phosphate 3-kinase C2 domain-containing subunit alpha [Polypterus senegalus]|uniref:phosphatidylinositol 4-phosphate 3-kinase C2 domain-containing subunit alpha n=1 Tax=Polypterus senegalus TaxID=55291 RepID=UPI001964B38E|nr:phosphatidylinositol 4-phosphate 3-kinase C2 domain-containing subunit alpha [Polypterus senegalus]